MMTVNEAQNVHFLRFAAMTVLLYQALEANVPHFSTLVSFLMVLDGYSLLRSLELAGTQGRRESEVGALEQKAFTKTMLLVIASWILVLFPSLVNTWTKNFSLTFIAFLAPLGMYVLALKKVEKMISETATKIKEGE